MPVVVAWVRMCLQVRVPSWARPSTATSAASKVPYVLLWISPVRFGRLVSLTAHREFRQAALLHPAIDCLRHQEKLTLFTYCDAMVPWNLASFFVNEGVSPLLDQGESKVVCVLLWISPLRFSLLVRLRRVLGKLHCCIQPSIASGTRKFALFIYCDAMVPWNLAFFWWNEGVSPRCD
jgi:hypothetical protein